MLKFVEDLLQGAPVEWKTLGEVFETRNGYTPSKKEEKYWRGGTIPWFRMEDLRTSGTLLSTAIQRITPEAIRGKGLFRANSIIMATTATIGEHALLLVDALANQRFTNFRIRETYEKCLLPKFAYYYFYILDAWCLENTYIGSFPSVDVEKLKLQKFPIPPLPVQEKIVEILDKFTELEAKLGTELVLRQKQYEYYRNKLLTFGEEVEWRQLGEIGEIRMCKRIMKNQTSASGEIPFYKIGTFGKEADAYISRELFSEYKSKYNYPRAGDVLISASGTIGRVVLFDGEDAYFQDSNIVWIENEEKKVLNKYLFYCYQIAKWNISEGGTIQRLYNNDLKKTLIPIPYPNDIERSLSEQARIVSILDKFDTLINSITEGLPREIALRHKQYEYYRDALLTFPKAT